jgi:diguanylate cyclase (GGDEF)-like protein
MGGPRMRTTTARTLRQRKGMAAIDHHPRSNRLPPGEVECLSAPALRERIDEEIVRAERHGTQLSCLLVVIDEFEAVVHEQGTELREQTLSYVAVALGRELRRFDRIGRPSELELLIVLPGADGPRGEMVARRVLDRLRTIKLEAQGARRPLRVSVGLAAWRDESSAEDLLTRTRAAAHGGNPEDMQIVGERAKTTARRQADPPSSAASQGAPSAL